ncbi:MAG: hypothetical protein ACNS61_09490 [Candidatus Wenzhouxiangella sp. M2_3B_020]
MLLRLPGLLVGLIASTAFAQQLERAGIPDGGATAGGGPFEAIVAIGEPLGSRSSGDGFELYSGFLFPQPRAVGSLIFRDEFEAPPRHRTSQARRCTMIARFLLCIAMLPLGASGQTSTFTYQGYLTEAGTASEGAYDFELALYNVDTAGSAIDVNAFDDVTVTGGLFSLPADFTGAPFEAGGSYRV